MHTCIRKLDYLVFDFQLHSMHPSLLGHAEGGVDPAAGETAAMEIAVQLARGGSD